MESVVALLTISTSDLLVLLSVALFSALLWKRKMIIPNLPPGPRGVPVFGYLPFFLKEQPHETFTKLAEKYGDIFSMYLGKRLVVVLNSYESITKAFIEQANIFVGRPGNEDLKEGELPGIFQAEGKLWQDYKRHSMRLLRDQGFGKSSMDLVVQKEMGYVLKAIDDRRGEPTDIGELIRFSLANVICTVMMNFRFDYEDKTLKYLMWALNEYLSRAQMVNYEFFIPSLLRVPFIASWVGYEPSAPYAALILQEMKKKVAQRSSDHQLGENYDFVSAWLNETERLNRTSATKIDNHSDDHLAEVLRSLFNAGTDTIALTLRWTLLHLMENPHIQERIQKEVDEVIGADRLPAFEDQEKMPYTEATLLEAHRIASILPIANRCNIRDTELNGYFIPKRAIIMPNLWAVHYDPETFPEPDKFRPERFLDSEGRIAKPKKYIPFSIGKRQCVGESYTRISLFIFLTALLQRYTFRKPEGDTLSFEYHRCMVTIPKPFRTIAAPRTLIRETAE